MMEERRYALASKIVLFIECIERYYRRILPICG